LPAFPAGGSRFAAEVRRSTQPPIPGRLHGLRRPPTIAGASLKKGKFKGLGRDGTVLAWYAVMRIAGPLDAYARTGLKTWAAAPRGCEKSSASSDLEDQRPGFNADRRRPLSSLRGVVVSQDETPQSGASCDGPLLLPAFAAQLIAQAMPG